MCIAQAYLDKARQTLSMTMTQSNAYALALQAAFATNVDPLNGKYPRDPVYDRLFTKIVNQAPAPIGLGGA